MPEEPAFHSPLLIAGGAVGFGLLFGLLGLLVEATTGGEMALTPRVGSLALAGFAGYLVAVLMVRQRS